MITYYLTVQPDDGRVVLDRECHGFPLTEIEVDDPPVIRRERLDGRMVEATQYHESFAAARRKVKESDFERVPGEGYFLKRKQ